MINPAFLVRLYKVSAALAVLSAAGSYLCWHNPAIPAGLLLGVLIGLSPFISWHVIMVKTRGFQDARRGWIVALTMTKYAMIAALLYAGSAQGWIHTAALISGILTPMLLLWVLGGAHLLMSPNNDKVQ